MCPPPQKKKLKETHSKCPITLAMEKHSKQLSTTDNKKFGNIKQTFCIKIIIHKTTLKLMPHAPQQAENLYSDDPVA